MVTEGKEDKMILNTIPELSLPEESITTNTEDNKSATATEPVTVDIQNTDTSVITSSLHKFETEIISIRDEIRSQPTQQDCHTDIISKLIDDINKLTKTVTILSNKVSIFEKENSYLRKQMDGLKNLPLQIENMEEKIECSQTDSKMKLSELEFKIQSLRETQIELEGSVQFLSNGFDQSNEEESTQNSQSSQTSVKELYPKPNDEKNVKTRVGDGTAKVSNVDTLIIGSSILRDIDSSRFLHNSNTKIIIPSPRTIASCHKVFQQTEENAKNIIIAVGSNDVANNPFNLDMCISNIDNLVHTVSTTRPESKIFISEILPRFNQHTDDYRRNFRIFNDALNSICEKYKCGLITHSKFNSFDFLPDGVHLNDLGTSKLVKTIKDNLLPYRTNMKKKHNLSYPSNQPIPQPRMNFQKWNQTFRRQQSRRNPNVRNDLKAMLINVLNQM